MKVESLLAGVLTLRVWKVITHLTITYKVFPLRQQNVFVLWISRNRMSAPSLQTISHPGLLEQSPTESPSRCLSFLVLTWTIRRVWYG